MERLLNTPAMFSDANQSYFHHLLNSIDGALAIAITDKEGVPLILVEKTKLPPSILKISSTIDSSFEQSNRLGFGDTKHITAYFSNYQLVCFNKGMLFVTVIADAASNTGQIINADKDLSPIIQKVVEALEHKQIP